MEVSVGTSMETYGVAGRMRGAALQIRVLGSMSVRRNGVPVALPPSRKVRALLAFLVLSPSPVGRSRLCDLLWDGPNDPRGELRWCLSKMRTILDDADRRRVITSAHDLVALELADCFVDAIEIDKAAHAGLAHIPDDRLAEICDLFGGDLLDGLHIDGSPEFGGWVAAQRHRYRALHIAVLDELAKRSPVASEETFVRLDAWLRLAPFDPRAHEVLLGALVQGGRLRDADEHLAATIRAFEHEGLDWSALRETWRAARAAAAPSVRVDTPPASVVSAGPDAAARVKLPARRTTPLTTYSTFRMRPASWAPMLRSRRA